MGAGIAVTFRQRYPLMYFEYHSRCKANKIKLGDVFVWDTEYPVVFNIATQLRPVVGSATYQAIWAGLNRTKLEASGRNITSIAFPMIGCGIGGLNWLLVRKMFVTVFDSWPGDIILYEA
jgi:O-acetyl-ADP-ribose deacetylase (regulator of RNase III)